MPERSIGFGRYWLLYFGRSAFAVGGLLEEVRPQSAGHLSFVRDATANDSFHTLRAGAIDPLLLLGSWKSGHSGTFKLRGAPLLARPTRMQG